MQELNFARQSYAVDKLRRHQFVFPAIASELIDICSRGVGPGYKGEPPPKRRIAIHPYVSEDTEKIVGELRKDIRDGVIIV